MRLIALVAIVSVIVIAGPESGGGSARPEAAQAPRAIGTLRGRVDIRRAIGVTARRPGIADLTTLPPAGTPDARPAVVYLETADVPGASPLRDGLTGSPPGRARMDQLNETFSPRVLAVTTGTVVDFPNSDRTYHNVFSLSKAKRFDLGRYGKGKSASERFDLPGVVRVFCDIHSHMSAFVLVFNHPYHTTTDSDGRYRIDNIPAGRYTVTAWHEGEVRDTRMVTIPPTAGPIDLDLLVQ